MGRLDVERLVAECPQTSPPLEPCLRTGYHMSEKFALFWLRIVYFTYPESLNHLQGTSTVPENSKVKIVLNLKMFITARWVNSGAVICLGIIEVYLDMSLGLHHLLREFILPLCFFKTNT